jgi:hypothetical protein
VVTNRHEVTAKRRQPLSFLAAFKISVVQVPLIRETCAAQTLFSMTAYGLLYYFLASIRLNSEGEGIPMKKSFLAVTLLALLVLGTRDLQAQAYGPSYYDPYWDAQYQQYQQYQQYLQWQQYLAYLQQTDPYYDLHVMHYQLYLPQYPSYQLYQPCCFAAGVVIAQQPSPVGPRPRPFVSPRSQAAVGPLPRATGPLPPAIGRR